MNKCTSEINRSNCCTKCGEEGHKAEKCTATLCCNLWKEAGNKETNHVRKGVGNTNQQQSLRGSQDLLYQKVREEKVYVVIIGDQYRNLDGLSWKTGAANSASMHVVKIPSKK